MKVVIIGSGNVATILAIKLKNAGHNILQVYNKTIINAAILAKKVNAKVAENIKDIETNADFYIIAVADNALQNIATSLTLKPKSIVVHTAGAIGIDVLKQCCKNYGVLYPIQSVKKEMNINTTVPFVVNANNDFAFNKIKLLVESMNENFEVLNDEQRLQLHIAAVFANNFVNYMYINAFKICTKNNIKFSLLQPLIEETATRLKNNKPNKVFTGPAVRKDMTTINKHLEILKKNKKQFEVYQFLTNKIIEGIK